MCADWLNWEWAKADLTFGQLANVQTVGLGLYLALAIIQAVSSTGTAGLARRVTTLRNAVASNRLGSVEAANVRRLNGAVSGLEIGFHGLHRAILWTSFALFGVALIYFGYCTIWQSVDAGLAGVWFIFFYYLILPVLIFGWSTILVGRRCKDIAEKIGEAEKRIRKLLLNL